MVIGSASGGEELVDFLVWNDIDCYVFISYLVAMSKLSVLLGSLMFLAHSCKFKTDVIPQFSKEVANTLVEEKVYTDVAGESYILSPHDTQLVSMLNVLIEADTSQISGGSDMLSDEQSAESGIMYNEVTVDWTIYMIWSYDDTPQDIVDNKNDPTSMISLIKNHTTWEMYRVVHNVVPCWDWIEFINSMQAWSTCTEMPL